MKKQIDIDAINAKIEALEAKETEAMKSANGHLDDARKATDLKSKLKAASEAVTALRKGKADSKKAASTRETIKLLEDL